MSCPKRNSPFLMIVSFCATEAIEENMAAMEAVVWNYRCCQAGAQNTVSYYKIILGNYLSHKHLLLVAYVDARSVRLHALTFKVMTRACGFCSLSVT